MIQIIKKMELPDERYSLLLADLAQTKIDLESAYANFENVTEPDLIDACIYEVNAVQMKYKFLLNRVKMEQERLHL